MATSPNIIALPVVPVGPKAWKNMAQREGRPTDAEVWEQLTGIVTRLQTLADDQVRRKSPIEQRWLEDLRAFHGKYDADTEKALRDGKKSRAFVKITRKLTNSWEGRLSGLLFPTDDRNWGIQPTPVPKLANTAKEAVQRTLKLVEQANQTQAQDPQAAAATAQQADQYAQFAKQMQAEIEEAKKCSNLMQEEMDDQLTECQYQAKCRDGIRDMVRLGTMVMKGPLQDDRQRGSWQTDPASGMHVYSKETDPAPVYKRVDPWSYFPDMSSTCPEDAEFAFERHLWTAKDLRRLVKENGFHADSVRELLSEKRDGPMTQPGIDYLINLRAITGEGDAITGRYVGWEYHGALECAEIVTLMRAMEQWDEADAYEEAEDPLEERRVIAYFCEGKLLKVAPEYPLDSGETLYSVAPFEPGEASQFGYGVPNVIGDSQRAINGGWRMAMDNSALSVGPQIFMDIDSIEPVDGVWEIVPKKIWRKKKAASTSANPMVIENIPNNVNEIMAIVNMAREFANEEASLPVQAQGEQMDNPNQTATAATIMASGSNVIFRRVVKAFDDGITAPSMRRLYDWNMQFSRRDEIKGDMSIDARGTSVLMVREIQSQMLVNLAQNWTVHPSIAPMLDPYKLISKTLQAMMIPPDDVMVSEDDYKKFLEQQAQQKQPDDPAVVAANARLEAAKIDSTTRIQVSDQNHDTEMMKLAEMKNMSVDKLRTLLAAKQMDTDSSERKMAAEMAVEKQMQREAAARGEQPQGSGGSFSA